MTFNHIGTLWALGRARMESAACKLRWQLCGTMGFPCHGQLPTLMTQSEVRQPTHVDGKEGRKGWKQGREMDRRWGGIEKERRKGEIGTEKGKKKKEGSNLEGRKKRRKREVGEERSKTEVRKLGRKDGKGKERVNPKLANWAD